MKSLSQQNQSLYGEQRTYDEDTSNLRKQIIQLEMQISGLPQNPSDIEQKQKTIRDIQTLQRRIRNSGDMVGTDWDKYRSQCKENQEREFSSISIEINNYDEDLLRYIIHFAKK